MPASKHILGLILVMSLLAPQAIAQQRRPGLKLWNPFAGGSNVDVTIDSQQRRLLQPTGVELEYTPYAEDWSEPIANDDSQVYLSDEGVACDADGCDSPYCDSPGCNSGACRETYWVRAQYLYWGLRGARLPPLITTSAPGTDFADAGILGLPTTSILLGSESIAGGGRSGGRIELGSWFEGRDGLGWHVAYFGFPDTGQSSVFNSSRTPILARPFFSVEPGDVGPNAALIAFPGEVTGFAVVRSSTSFDGAELMLRHALVHDRCRRLQFVAGYQYLGLNDDLSIRDFAEIIGPSSGLAIGTTIAESDQFQSKNRFNGGTIGFLGAVRNRQWTVDGGMQAALGNNTAKVRINGATTSSVPVQGGGNQVATTVGGLLALPSNIGNYQQDVFAVAPQLYVNLGYDLTPQLRATIGYRFLYWSQVARAAEQIDTAVNFSQLDPGGTNGAARPKFDFQLTDFWAQGLTAGIDFQF